jgi:hypothetical protein
MSPDLEWHVDDQSGEQTIARTTPPRSPRWRWLVIGVIVILGAGIGVLYHLIPEPPAPPASIPAVTGRPTVWPSPTPLPPPGPLAESIAIEAAALSSGNTQLFMSLQDPNDDQWRQKQRADFKPWGTPPPGDERLYTIALTGTLSNDRAWADVIQPRDGRYFRETRFYRLAQNHSFWLRTRPVLDPDFWGKVVSETTEHFDVVFHERDAFPAAWSMSREFEQLYASACNVLGCWGVLPPGRQFALFMSPTVDEVGTRVVDGQHITITLPSPSIMGVYYQSASNPLDTDPRVERYFDRYVYDWLVNNIAGGPGHLQRSHTASPLLVGAIENWGRVRLGWASPEEELYHPELLDSKGLPSLATVWAWPETASVSGIEDLLLAESTALIKFIDETYGAEKVAALLRAARDAQSLPDAIKIAGLSYPEFSQNWQAWLKHFIATKK